MQIGGSANWCGMIVARALKNSQLLRQWPGERYAYFGDRTQEPLRRRLGWRMEFEMREETSLPGATAPADKPIDPLQSFKDDPMIQKALEIFKAEIQSDR